MVERRFDVSRQLRFHVRADSHLIVLFVEITCPSPLRLCLPLALQAIHIARICLRCALGRRAVLATTLGCNTSCCDAVFTKRCITSVGYCCRQLMADVAGNWALRSSMSRGLESMWSHALKFMLGAQR